MDIFFLEQINTLRVSLSSESQSSWTQLRKTATKFNWNIEDLHASEEEEEEDEEGEYAPIIVE